jgi:competence protein ComGC
MKAAGPKQVAFKLLDPLVVMAGISILAAMLLPALTCIKEHAKLLGGVSILKEMEMTLCGVKSSDDSLDGACSKTKKVGDDDLRRCCRDCAHRTDGFGGLGVFFPDPARVWVVLEKRMNILRGILQQPTPYHRTTRSAFL